MIKGLRPLYSGFVAQFVVLVGGDGAGAVAGEGDLGEAAEEVVAQDEGEEGVGHGEFYDEYLDS
jgi:hypothetical protein